MNPFLSLFPCLPEIVIVFFFQEILDAKGCLYDYPSCLVDNSFGLDKGVHSLRPDHATPDVTNQTLCISLLIYLSITFFPSF